MRLTSRNSDRYCGYVECPTRLVVHHVEPPRDHSVLYKALFSQLGFSLKDFYKGRTESVDVILLGTLSADDRY